MTVSATTNTVSYTGDASATDFAVTFPFLGTGGSSELVVIERVISTGVETTKTYTSHYTITGGSGNTGTVIAASAPAATVEWHIQRGTNQTQLTDYVANDPFAAETHEAALDRLAMIAQELQVEINRCIKFPASDASLASTLDSSVDRANKTFGFNATGAVQLLTEIGDWQGNWGTSTAYVTSDIVATTGRSYICIVAHTSGTFATDLAAAKWELVADKGSTGAAGADGADGTMAGPDSSTDNGIATYNGTDGATVQDTTATIDDSNNMYLPGTLDLGHASDTTLSRSAAGVLAVEGVGVGLQGQHTIFVPAGAMEAAVTTAAATSNAVEIGTSLFAARTMDFATDADDFAYFGIQMPKSWNAGTLVCQFVWSATGTTANTVLWGIAANSIGNDGVLTEAFATPTSPAADTNSTTADDIMISAEVSLTVGSTPTAEDFVIFEVSRDVSGDTLAENARLHGIKIHYTTDTGNDN